MKLFRFSAFALLFASLIATGCSQKPELHIYTWSDYIAPEVIADFEEDFGCRVVIDTFDSNETMYAKLKAGGSGYDIIMPSSYLVSLMARENLILKLDHSKMPNVKKNFDPSFACQILDAQLTYSVPYAVTYTGFMYLKNRMPEGLKIDSWDALMSPALRGKVTLLDDIREVIGAGLMSLGYSINSHDPKEIDAAVRQVLKWRENVRKFDAESYKNEVASGAIWLGHGYSTDAMQVILGDEDEGLVGPDGHEPRLDVLGGSHAVDDEHDVVAHEDGGDEEVGAGVEDVEYAPYDATFLHVELHADAVGGDVGDLDA